jgi:AraC family transcriptional regulator of adaptative response/methylated-DNA-[protein]-cysteine methyltransferase
MNVTHRSRPTRRPAAVARARAADGARWAALAARDPAADGSFVFAVRTTGVYCRPSCGARRPKPANVVFFADGEAARVAGFRACKRCRPDAATSDHTQRTRLVAEVCRWIDAADTPPRLAELAARAGYSPFHLQRVFVATLGVSPRAYAQARRDERLRGELAAGRSVTAAMHRAGFGSTSRLHAAAERAVGMAPKRARTGGTGERIEFAALPCSLGTALVAATARGVCAILLGDDASRLQRDLARRFANAELVPGGVAFRTRAAVAIAHVDGDERTRELPLDLHGTVFQQRVWRELRRIPNGRTATYTDIARRLGAPNSARAVAKACGDNPVAIVVPCHRVVRRDGELAGYRWGLARKRALLAREGAGRATGEA